MDAIIYTTNSGSTAQYAQMLGEKTGLSVYALSVAKEYVAAGSEILYLGWLMAGTVKGYAKAAKQYRVSGVCGVGMGHTGTQLQEIRSKNRIPAQTAVFTLQGDLDITKLRGVYKLMMQVMLRTAGKGLEQKQNRTPEEDEMLNMLHHGTGWIREENLDAVLDWYSQQK